MLSSCYKLWRTPYRIEELLSTRHYITVQDICFTSWCRLLRSYSPRTFRKCVLPSHILSNCTYRLCWVEMHDWGLAKSCTGWMADSTDALLPRAWICLGSQPCDTYSWRIKRWVSLVAMIQIPEELSFWLAPSIALTPLNHWWMWVHRLWTWYDNGLNIKLVSSITFGTSQSNMIHCDSTPLPSNTISDVISNLSAAALISYLVSWILPVHTRSQHPSHLERSASATIKLEQIQTRGQWD